MKSINKIKGKWVKLEVGVNFMGDPAYRKAWVGKFQGYDLRHYLGDMWEIIQNGKVVAQKWTREEMVEELSKLAIKKAWAEQSKTDKAFKVPVIEENNEDSTNNAKTY